MLIVVRHGRTTANASGLLLGRSDPPLDNVGREQAARLAAALSDVARVVSSPLGRARETADMIAAASSAGVGVEIDERFLELDYGEFDGQPTAEVPAEVWATWRADPDFCPPGGESLATLRSRVVEACEELGPDAQDRDIVVVTHVSPVKASVGWALGAGFEVNWHTFVQPASITRIGFGPAGPVLHGFNDTHHLML